MHILDVYYYYSYLAYRKFDPDPRYAAKFGVSGMISFFIGGIIVWFFQVDLNPWIGLMIAMVILFCNLRYYNKQRVKRILSQKPCFFKNRVLTICIVIFSYIIAISWLFWGPFVEHNLFK